MPRTEGAKPDGAVGVWDERGMRPPLVGVLDAIARRATHVLADLPDPVGGHAINGDCRTVLGHGRQFRWVVTSPPYLGMRTYVPDQWLRRWLLGGAPQVDYNAGG